MLVYVINKNGNPLMPCKPSKARKLLRDKKAKIVNYAPFTIQLQWDCEEYVQKVSLGIDRGSSYTGYCAISKDKVLISGRIDHRLDIKEKMDARRGNRKSRRSRMWYRKPRFLNRASSRRAGRLAPSIKASVEEVFRVIRKLPIPIFEITAAVNIRNEGLRMLSMNSVGASTDMPEAVRPEISGVFQRA